MSQKGFATIFGLCLALVIALIVRGIAESEANHAREVSNFEFEQVLQSAAESGIFEAADKIRETPTFNGTLTTSKTFKHGEQTINITISVKSERGKIYNYDNAYNYADKVKDKRKCLIKFDIYKDGEITPEKKNYYDGVYLMSLATIENGFLDEKIRRYAYAYFVDDAEVDDKYKNKIYFMELPSHKPAGESYVGIINKVQ